MDRNIINLLKKYDLTDGDIKGMLNNAPMLEVTSFSEFSENCKILAKYGYPEADLDFLFLANPNIFVLGARTLEADLKKLQVQYDDIEEILKADPYIV